MVGKINPVNEIMVQIPEFPVGSVPVSVASRVFGKSAEWVRECMRNGRLDIGVATVGGSRTNIYISPLKLWIFTGYVWDGEGRTESEENS